MKNQNGIALLLAGVLQVSLVLGTAAPAPETGKAKPAAIGAPAPVDKQTPKSEDGKKKIPVKAWKLHHAEKKDAKEDTARKARHEEWRKKIDADFKSARSEEMARRDKAIQEVVARSKKPKDVKSIGTVKNKENKAEPKNEKIESPNMKTP